MPDYADRRQLVQQVVKQAENCLKHAYGLSILPVAECLMIETTAADLSGGLAIAYNMSGRQEIVVDDWNNGHRLEFTKDGLLVEKKAGERGSRFGGAPSDRDLGFLRGRIVSLQERMEVILSEQPQNLSIMPKSPIPDAG